MNQKRPPARLKVLLARNAPFGLIIRRGPARHVCTIGWNRQTDEFQIGQWLKGRIYEERTDLSPDGRHFIYFAGHHRYEPETFGTWTAISRTPYLKAKSIWAKGDSWHGGGLFLDNTTALIHGGHRNPLELSKDIRAVMDVRNWGRGNWTKSYGPPEGIEPVKNLSDYLTKTENEIYETCVNTRGASYRTYTLYRDGWRLNKNGDENGENWWHGKHATQHWWLRKPQKGQGFVLINRKTKQTHVLSDNASWAEIDDWGNWQKLPAECRAVWTEDGKLFATKVKPKGIGEPKLLYDFNPLEFEALTAPY